MPQFPAAGSSPSPAWPVGNGAQTLRGSAALEVDGVGKDRRHTGVQRATHTTHTPPPAPGPPRAPPQARLGTRVPTGLGPSPAPPRPGLAPPRPREASPSGAGGPAQPCDAGRAIKEPALFPGPAATWRLEWPRHLGPGAGRRLRLLALPRCWLRSGKSGRPEYAHLMDGATDDLGVRVVPGTAACPLAGNL